MIAEASAAGGIIAAIHHRPEYDGLGEQCSCRKPEIGMFLQAQRDFPDINFSAATVIGDSASDVAAGARLGCRTILIGDDEQHGCAASLVRRCRNISDVTSGVGTRTPRVVRCRSVASGCEDARPVFLSHRLPYAPNRGDRLRVYHMLREVAGPCRG